MTKTPLLVIALLITASLAFAPNASAGPCTDFTVFDAAKCAVCLASGGPGCLVDPPLPVPLGVVPP